MNSELSGDRNFIPDLYIAGAVSEMELKKLREEAEKHGKSGFEFAYVMDKIKEERERGVTIDVSYKKFAGKKNDFTIIDAPGHRDFVKNMITGTSQADAAVLVISAKDGIQAQTKEHAFLAQVMGLKQIIIALNKMDEMKYEEKAFNDRKAEITKLLGGIGYKMDTVKIIPLSAWIGDNVAKKSDKMAWYKGQTLVDALDDFTAPPLPTDKPLRLPLQDVYNIKGVGTVPVGRVETGILRPGDTIIIEPSGKTGEVKSVEMHHEQLTEAKPGDNVGFNVRGFGKKDIARGDVVGHTSNVPTIATEFTAQLVVLNHPTVITVGYTPVFHIHTAQVACQFVSLEKKLNPATGEVVAEKPDFIKNGDAAIVKLKPVQPLCIEKQKEIPHMARFAIRDSGATVAAGMCIDLVKK